jgi:hypothetical protein
MAGGHDFCAARQGNIQPFKTPSNSIAVALWVVGSEAARGWLAETEGFAFCLDRNRHCERTSRVAEAIQ